MDDSLKTTNEGIFPERTVAAAAAMKGFWQVNKLRSDSDLRENKSLEVELVV